MSLGRVLDRILADIGILLDINTLQSPNGTDSIEDQIRQDKSQIIEFLESGETDRARWHINRLAMFAKHLQEVRESDQELFLKFKEELISDQGGDYYGTRFELDIAASLLRKGHSFDHIDPPDFRIDFGSGDVDIEATSVHFAGGDRTIEEKVKSAIYRKTNSAYSHRNGAIFIDTTNIQFAAFERGKRLDGDVLEEWAKEVYQNFPSVEVGSVVFFVYLVEREDDSQTGLHHNYQRTDRRKIGTELQEFLDQEYPIEDFEVSDPFAYSSP